MGLCLLFKETCHVTQCILKQLLMCRLFSIKAPRGVTALFVTSRLKERLATSKQIFISLDCLIKDQNNVPMTNTNKKSCSSRKESNILNALTKFDENILRKHPLYVASI